MIYFGLLFTWISVTNSTFKDNANYDIFIVYDIYDIAKYNKDIDTVNTFINNESGEVGSIGGRKGTSPLYS